MVPWRINPPFLLLSDPNYGFVDCVWILNSCLNFFIKFASKYIFCIDLPNIIKLSKEVPKLVITITIYPNRKFIIPGVKYGQFTWIIPQMRVLVYRTESISAGWIMDFAPVGSIVSTRFAEDVLQRWDWHKFTNQMAGKFQGRLISIQK